MIKMNFYKLGCVKLMKSILGAIKDCSLNAILDTILLTLFTKMQFVNHTNIILSTPRRHYWMNNSHKGKSTLNDDFSKIIIYKTFLTRTKFICKNQQFQQYNMNLDKTKQILKKINCMPNNYLIRIFLLSSSVQGTNFLKKKKHFHKIILQ